jgi:WD40 repeat protein
MHIILNDQYEVVSEIRPLVDDAPYHASFSRDGELLALSSAGFSRGATLVVPTSRFPGLSVSSENLEKHWFSKETVTEMRGGLRDLDRDLTLIDAESIVCATAWRGEEFIMGDADGYLRAFDKTGEALWQHFIGSSVSGIDLSPDGKTLVVTTCAGFVCILDLDTGEPDPFAISTATHRERRRWLFWTKEPKPLVW